MNTMTNAPDHTTEPSLARLIHGLDRLIRAEQREVLRSAGLHRGEYRSLRRLASGDARQGLLGGHWHRLRNLVRRGLVRVDGERPELSEAGAELLAAVTAEQERIRTQMLASLEPEAVASLTTNLQAVFDSLGGVTALRALKRAEHGRHPGRRERGWHGEHRRGRGFGPMHRGQGWHEYEGDRSEHPHEWVRRGFGLCPDGHHPERRDPAARRFAHWA